MTAAADIVNLARARRANEFSDRADQIEAVNVIADLFALVAEYTIGPAGHGADHEVGQKSVKLRACMRRTSQTSAAQCYGRHSKIAPVFLNEEVGRGLRCAEK